MIYGKLIDWDTLKERYPDRYIQKTNDDEGYFHFKEFVTFTKSTYDNLLKENPNEIIRFEIQPQKLYKYMHKFKNGSIFGIPEEVVEVVSKEEFPEYYI